MEININLKENSYNIITGRNILENISSYFNFENKKVLILTDSNIPLKYISRINSSIDILDVVVIKAGEESKSLENYQLINEKLLELNFSRHDVLITLGGGVITDLGGFVASTYKRGISLINIPSSSLAMIDSSIGGKTGINFNKTKNIIGTFYQPKLVLIDFSLLESLPLRHLNNGLIEALKCGYIYDSSILDLFKDDIYASLEEIIIKSILVKKHFVEEDEKEENIRKILNFGHSFGHAFESLGGFNDSLYHGEAVALGMLVVLEDKTFLMEILKRLDIHYDFNIDEKAVLTLMKNDKKVKGDNIELIKIKNNIGAIELTPLHDLENILKGGLDYVRRFRK